MADPVTVFVAAMSLGQAFNSIFQSGKQKEAQEEAYEEQRKAQAEEYKEEITALETNIGITESNIEQLKGNMEYDIGVLEEQQKKFNVKQRAAFGASGAVVGTGSPMQVMMETLASQQAEMQNLKSGYESDIAELELELGGYRETLQQKRTLLSELMGKNEEEETEIQSEQTTEAKRTTKRDDSGERLERAEKQREQAREWRARRKRKKEEKKKDKFYQAHG